MKFNDVLHAKGIDPQQVIMFRHRPQERELNKVMPWLAAERPDVFNAYQQTQHSEKVERALLSLQGHGYVAAFLGLLPGQATFIGIYRIAGNTPLSLEDYWRVPAYQEMKKLGMKGFTPETGRESLLWFDLQLIDACIEWQGRLVVGWPPPERSWWRRAHRNEMPIICIHEESRLDKGMPDWDELRLSWDELRVLPQSWKQALSQWRGIYYIFDVSDGKGYVGCAGGKENFYGRWLGYALSGDGGNKLLKGRDPKNFRFSILQRVSPDMEQTELVRVENSWKERLHTRHPSGLNDN